MDKAKRLPASNISEPVSFLLNGAKKRRSLAIAKAKMIQSDLNVIPRLFAIK